MAASQIDTRFTPFTTDPVLGTATYPEGIDVRNTEMNSRMQEIDDIGQEMNIVAGEVNTNASNASDSADAASDSEDAAAVSETQAGDYAASYSATSASSILVGTGSKTFTVQAGKLFVTGQYLLISDNATPSNYMHGQVTSYSGTTLEMNITNTGGSGTIALWDIAISGARGAVGGGLTDLVDDGTPQLGGNLDTNSKQIQLSKGADVASASALPILTDGNYFDVTGTTTITSIDTTGKVGTVIKLHFDGILTLTHDATDLILLGGENITTAAGDEAEFVEYASGDFRCTNYSAAAGAAGGAWEVISTTEISSPVAQVDIEHNFTTSDYKNFQIVLDNVLGGAAFLYLNLKRDAAWLTGAEYETSTTEYDTGSTPNDHSTNGVVNLETEINASSGVSGYIYPRKLPDNVNVVGWDLTQSNASVSKRFIGNGLYAEDPSGGDFTGVRLYLSTGNLLSGTITLIGLKA